MADSRSVGILLVLLLSDSVYCQDQISRYAGSDVLLNCSYTTSSNLNVFWRYRDAHNVIDIINGIEVLTDQDQRFRGRIVTFPDLITKGNFSVVLKNVNLNDTGPYNCDIPKVDYRQKLHLNVTVRPTEGPSTAKPKVTSPPSGDSVSEHSYSSLLSIVLSLTLALRNYNTS